MLCEKCGKNAATTHIKTVINGKVTEINLCGYCAAKEGYTSLSGGSLSGLLSSMLGKAVQTADKLSARRCECCKATFADIAEKGKVGCANCYIEFKEELLPYLKRIHGSVHHSGKSLSGNKLAIKPEKETVHELKVKLAQLVAEERYEEAAILRDKIKAEEGEN